MGHSELAAKGVYLDTPGVRWAKNGVAMLSIAQSLRQRNAV